MRRIAVLDAPSNLGLRPPTATSVPGCAKAPGALRDHGLLSRLGARDAGCLTPPRYDPGEWRPGDGVCHAVSIAAYSKQLANRIGAIIDAGEFPLVLGGDCSIVLGSALAMNRLGEDVGGRIGLVFVDGHSDFRHPGNASYVGAAAGEDLALVTGRGQPDLAAIEGRRPYFRDVDVVVLGIRGHDEYRLDLQAAGIVTRPVPALRAEGAARTAQWARDQLVDCAGYWVHVDVDVLDPAVMPAVDAPEPGGIAFPELELLLAGLVDTPHCLGVEITVFDPDYDTDGSYAEEITAAVVSGLAPVRAADAPPRRQPAARDTPAGPATPPSRPAPSPVSTAARPATAEAAVTEPLHRTAQVDAPHVVTAAVGTAGSDSSVQQRGDDPAVEQPSEEGWTGSQPVADEPVAEEPADEPAAGEHEEPHAAWPGRDDEVPAVPDPVVSAPVESAPVESPPVVSGPAEPDPVEAGTDHGGPEMSRPGAGSPFGSRSLLESELLPPSAPGKLRPRPVDAFTLPVQRPAFDAGDVSPADQP
jgi:arginase